MYSFATFRPTNLKVMKNLFAAIFLGCSLFSGGISAQAFDTLAYKQTYKNLYENSYFGDSLTAETKIAGLSHAWAEAKYAFANFDLIPQVNWDSTYQAYLPKVLETTTKTEYYKVLTQFYTHLKDGHSRIVPPRDLWNESYSALPIRAAKIEEKVVITDLLLDEPQYAVLKPGVVISKINGQPVEEYTNKNILPQVSYSTAQDSLARLYSWEFTRGALAEKIELELVTSDGKFLAKSFDRLPAEKLFFLKKGWSYKELSPGTNLLTIDTFADEALVPYLDSIFQKTAHPANLIVDIRNNGGGNGNNGFELLGYLSEDSFLTGKNYVRHYRPTMRAWGDFPDELQKFQHDWKPYKGPTFTGKVVVLAGPNTYSAAEDFLAAFKETGRGKIIGEATGGSTGQPMMFSMPFGGMGFVCSKKDLMPNGTHFVGFGIKPDLEVKPQLKNFQAGKDDVLEAALTELKKTKS